MKATVAEAGVLGDRSLLLPCQCGCHIVSVTEWEDYDDDDPAEWFLSFYESRHRGPWYWRVKQAWRVLRGADVAHDVVWSPEQVRTLRTWLDTAPTQHRAND